MKNDKKIDFRHIEPGCASGFSQCVSEFYASVRDDHSITHGNSHSIFLILKETSKEFTKYISTCHAWSGKDGVSKIKLDRLGIEAAKEIKNSYEETTISTSDAIINEIIETEDLIIESIKKSSEEYFLPKHREYVSVLETTRFLLEFLRTREPQRHVYIKNNLDESRRNKKENTSRIIFCELCWRLAKSKPNETRGLRPKYCRVHNQKRTEIAEIFFKIPGETQSKYRTDLAYKKVFTDTYKEIQSLIVSRVIDIGHPPGEIYFSALKKIMRYRYIAYFVSKNSHRRKIS